MSLNICLGISNRDFICVAFPQTKTAGSFDPAAQNSSAQSRLARLRHRRVGQLLLGDLALEEAQVDWAVERLTEVLEQAAASAVQPPRQTPG
jgi:hypothetical protein